MAALALGIRMNLQRLAGNHLDALLIERVTARIAEFNSWNPGLGANFFSFAA